MFTMHSGIKCRYTCDVRGMYLRDTYVLSYQTMMEHVPCMNIPDAVPGSVVRVTDSVPSVRVSIALIHTATTPSVSFTVYMTGSNPTRITAVNNVILPYIFYLSYLLVIRLLSFSTQYTENIVINLRYLCCH